MKTLIVENRAPAEKLRRTGSLQLTKRPNEQSNVNGKLLVNLQYLALVLESSSKLFVDVYLIRDHIFPTDYPRELFSIGYQLIIHMRDTNGLCATECFCSFCNFVCCEYRSSLSIGDGIVSTTLLVRDAFKNLQHYPILHLYKYQNIVSVSTNSTPYFALTRGTNRRRTEYV